MATTATASATTGGPASSTSSGSAAVPDEETADEVKVFRSATQEEDPNELAGSSAELNADKQELAMEADIESQADFSQRVNPIFNPLAPLPWPSPGSNFLFSHLLALSPVYGAAMAQQQQKMAQVAAATAHLYNTAAAAIIARHSPNYMNLSGPFGASAAFERPPSFSISQPCTPSTANRNGQQQNGHHLNSPMASLGGVLGGITLSADRAHPNGQQRHHQQQRGSAGHTKTPKRDKAERREKKKQQQQSEADDKKEHIKKPMNAFMLFMKENRHKYMEEIGDKRKQSAELNKELGQIWQKMTRDEQQPYYEMAQRKREEHQRLYPNWTARENYAIHKRAKKRRTRERSLENNEQKKCRARFGVDNQAKWCKHCRRKKRCLNVRDSDSPVQVSSTTHPTTPLSLAGPSGQFGGLGGMFGQQPGQDSPHSSRISKDCGQSNSEVSRCSSTTSSSGSAMSADDGQMETPEAERKPPVGLNASNKQNTMPTNGFKLEIDTATTKPLASVPPALGPHAPELPKPVPNMLNPLATHGQTPQQATAAHPSAFQMPPAGFPFQPNPFMPFNFGMPHFMKQ